MKMDEFHRQSLANFGYPLKPGQNVEPTVVFLYHELMTKKTPPHKKYGQLAKRLSLKSDKPANKLSESWLKLSLALKAASIALIKQNSGATCIQNLVYGKPRRAMTG
jgi:hypothetical protein